MSDVSRIIPHVTDNPWESCDLPVLQAVVNCYIENGQTPGPKWIARATGLDGDAVRRALRALHCQPFFEGSVTNANGEYFHIGNPTGAALRAAERWPSPEVQVARLVAAFEAAAANEALPEEERSRAAKVASWLGGTLSNIAISGLGGAAGNMLTG